MNVMGTSFGKRHGWELQRIRTDDGFEFWRVTGRTGWCHGASRELEILWRLWMRKRPEEFKVSK